MTLEVDASAFLAGFKRAMDDFERQAERQLDTTADLIVRRAKQHAAGRRRVAASIGRTPVQRDRRGPWVEVYAGAGFFPARFIEYGGYRHPAFPYMRPALMEGAARFGAGITL